MRSKGFSLDDAGGAMGDGEDAEADDGDDADSQEETDEVSASYVNLPIYTCRTTQCLLIILTRILKNGLDLFFT